MYRTLVRALQALAADPDDQVRSLPSFVCAADDLVESYHDAWALLDQIRRQFPISPAAMGHLAEIESHLGKGWVGHETGPETDHLLLTRPYWCEQRERARRALEALGEQRVRPLPG